ncbi:MAG TPA: ABC transporter permease [Candidatus Aenigmarchaeota archaeon]|nr:ABC transporter permease [Candidatus Aenigmarchaeota archaeon]
MKLWNLLRKEYLLTMRKKKFIFMILLLPFLIGIVYQLSTNLQPGVEIKVALCNLDEESTDLVEALKGKFSVVEVGGECEEEIKRMVREKEAFLGVIIPRDFTKKLEDFNKSEVYLFYDNSNPVLASYLEFFFQLSLRNYENALLSKAGERIREEVSKIEGLLEAAKLLVGLVGYGSELMDNLNQIQEILGKIKRMDVTFVTEPVVPVKEGAFELKNEKGVGAAIIFSILSLFTALLLVSSSVIWDRERKFLLRLRTSGTSSLTYILSKTIFFDLILALQFLVIFPLFSSFSWLELNLLSLFISILVVTSINTLLGMLVGIFSENQGIAILLSLLLTLPFLFISGIFYPSELFPQPLKFISDVFPLSNEIGLLKESMALGQGPKELEHLNVNLAYLSLFFLLSWLGLRLKH